MLVHTSVPDYLCQGAKSRTNVSATVTAGIVLESSAPIEETNLVIEGGWRHDTPHFDKLNLEISK